MIAILFTADVYSEPKLIWQPVQLAEARDNEKSHFYQLNRPNLLELLSHIELEGASNISQEEISLPLSETVERFNIVESPIMEAGLASRYPDIKTYKVFGIDNPQASGRISLSQDGLQGMITSPEGSYFIYPQDQEIHRSFLKNSSKESQQTFDCEAGNHEHKTFLSQSETSTRVNPEAGVLKTYRIAIATTREFVTASGNTKADTMVRVTNIINQVNQIYERDLAIRLQLVNNTDNLFSQDRSLYSTGNTRAMAGENQKITTSIIGSANYDIGHVFGTGGGGYGYYGVVCNDSWKAKGVSSGFTASYDELAIDLVAHEIGHQFDARHTFNGTTNFCGDNRNSKSAYEPGSGSTIMAYSGFCGNENIQYRSDAMFHAMSIDAIGEFTTYGSGASCAKLKNIGNISNPAINAGSDFSIPANTPFVLSAQGNDADGDALTYTWDQIDRGASTNKDNFGKDISNNPLMRSRLPQSTPSRHFPQLKSVIDGKTSKAETLPSNDRKLKFRVSVRDGKGGYDSDDLIVSATTLAGPFKVNTHGRTADLAGGNTQTINWSVADTDKPPVSCSSVNIDLLMLDAQKQNYCVEHLMYDVANSGNTVVTLPDMTIPNARFRVSCSDNIFYAISSADLSIAGSSQARTNCHSLEGEAEIRVNNNSFNNEPDSNLTTGSGSGGAIHLYILLLLAFRTFKKIN